jgi:putative membrane protein
MEETAKKQNVSDHLANERTLLAWVRTGIGIMAFGFVVVKFSLFIRQISLILGKNIAVPQYGYSAPIGIMLVAAGALCLLLALFRYHNISRQIDEETFHRTPALLYGIVSFILIAGIVLIIYLIKTT